MHQGMTGILMNIGKVNGCGPKKVGRQNAGIAEESNWGDRTSYSRCGL